MKVVYHQRLPIPDVYFSIEKSFDAMRQYLPSDISYRINTAKFYSRGVARRVLMAADAAVSQGDVHHITGDIHFLALALPARRTVLTIHDCGAFFRPDSFRRRIIERLWYRWPSRRASTITTVSAFTRDQLMRLTGCPAAKIRVVPTCIDSIFKTIPREFNNERPTVLHVGTRTNKNLPRLIEAVQGISCRLCIVGELSESDRQALAKHRVVYENHVNVSEKTLLQLYGECDLLHFASLYEGFGMPILEAQVVGRPVITSTVASMPEIAGEAAILVDPNDTSAIRAAIIRLINDSSFRGELVEAGFANARRFSCRKVAEDYADIYRSMIA